MEYPKLTEEQIEARVERAIDRLDKRLLSGELSQSDYDYEVGKVDTWSIQQMEWSKQ